LRDAHFFSVVFVVEGELGPDFALLGGELADVVVEAGDVDAAVGVVEGGEELAKRVGGVLEGAAVEAGVEVVGGAGEGDLGVDEPAEAVGDGGEAAGELVGVGDEGDVGF
jgi:hypothetical protein